MQLWINLLIANLRKIHTGIVQEGASILDLFNQEDSARKEFERQKKRGIASEESTR
jgi:hypothetical protein